tara:strand:+ start:126 stop:1841 length:1716 start_codon:yes stop_codon:yes gene_type:complete
MDRITKSLLIEFSELYELDDAVDEASTFEMFANYSIVMSLYNKSFDVMSVGVGAGHDTGIDGIGIIVNGHLVDDSEEVDELLSLNGNLEVSYILVQSKTSSKFSSDGMLAFFAGLKDFFAENPKLPRNSDLMRFANLSNYIYSKAASFRKNPVLRSFYVTTGRVGENDHHNALIETAKEELDQLGLFEEVNVSLWGATEIGNAYRKSKSPTSSTFVFTNKVALPDIEGISESYFGVIPFLECRKIIIDSNGDIMSVFDDNVRDFQGDANAVNQKISETLNSENPRLFSVLNNGITIVADKIQKSGNHFTIEDYQIVNGCQTSNVLYENRHIENIDLVDIPIRLIVTEDNSVKSEITISTNSQTGIKKEQLTSMTKFQKNLEAYYISITGEGQLYYERRAKQYAGDRTVVKRRIITIGNQIKSFSSMFNRNPHIVTTYFGSLVDKIRAGKATIFEDNHEYAPYYLAGLAYYRLDHLFTKSIIDKKYKKVRFYILMLLPKIYGPTRLTEFSSLRIVDKYCEPLIKILNNEKQCSGLFLKAINIIEKSGVDVEDKQALKSQTMTNKILKASSAN